MPLNATTALLISHEDKAIHAYARSPASEQNKPNTIMGSLAEETVGQEQLQMSDSMADLPRALASQIMADLRAYQRKASK
jgi:hypothetical protein